MGAPRPTSPQGRPPGPAPRRRRRSPALLLLPLILAACALNLEQRLERQMGEGARTDPQKSAPTGVLADPEVFEDAEGWPAPTPTEPPTPPPPSWDPAQRSAWAWKAFYDGRPDLAAPVFAGVTEDAPHRAEAFLGLGRSLSEEGDTLGAMAALNEAVDRAPAWGLPHLYRGQLLYRAEDYRGAMAALKDGWRAYEGALPSPGRRDLAYLLGRCALALGDRGEGALWTGRALEDGRVLGQVAPTEGMLRLPDGRIPAPGFVALGALPPETLPGILYFSHGGAITSWRGGEPFLEQVSLPPPGARDLLPAPGPGDALAFVHLGAGGGQRPTVMVARGAERAALPTLAALSAPAWGPKGDLYLVGSLGPSPQILLRQPPPDQGELRQVPGMPPGRVMDPLPLPGGGIIVSAERQGGLRLARVAPGQGLQWLTDLPHGEDPFLIMGDPGAATPTPTPGPQLPRDPMAVADPFGGSPQLRPVVRAVVRPPPQPVVAPYRFTWSPEDGARPPPEPPDPQAARMSEMRAQAQASVAAGLPRLVGPGEGDERHAALGPGGIIAFSRQLEGRRRIWVLEPEAGRQRPLTAPGRDCAEPTFVPGRDALVYVCQTAQGRAPFLFDLRRGEEARLLQVPGALTSPAFGE